MIENCLFPSHCANFYSMGEKSWLRRRIKDGLHRGFQHAYETVKVDPARFLVQLRAAYGLPITNLQGVYSVDITRELLEKEVINKFVPRVIQRIAVQASGEVVEKWSGRVIPVASSLIGAGLNYYFVRAWGERARSHFRERHLEMRNRIVKGSDAILLLDSAQGRQK